MDREFLDLYNQELQFLNDHAEEFAKEYPGIAERLGGLTRDNQDPTIAGLLEGAAFLAARVQLKLKHEFFEFTANYIEQLLPNYLAPTPSALLAKIVPKYGDPALRAGQTIARDEVIEATYLERDRRVACRYVTRAPITLWPLDLVDAAYLPSAAAVQAHGLTIADRTTAGIRLTLTHRSRPNRDEEPHWDELAKEPEIHVSGCRIDTLPIHMVGNEADAVAIAELLFTQLTNVWVRWRDPQGDPVVRALGPTAIEPIGYQDDDALLPDDRRVFRGFHVVQEYFLFPQKFLGLRINGLRRAFADAHARTVDIIFGFGRASSRASATVSAQMFTLYGAPAINLFPKTMDRVSLKEGQHEYHVVPDRSRTLDYEPHRITEVTAHLIGGEERVPVRPLYSASARSPGTVDGALYYTIRRLPRRRSAQERRYGSASNYSGTDVFISLSEPPGGDLTPSVAQLSVKGLCSNRHLTEQLPVGDGGVDFTLLSNTELEVYCASGPTPPRPPVVSYQANKSEQVYTGSVAWRLVNLLALNQLGLSDEGSGTGAHVLRELLSLFADPTDAATQRRVQSIRSLQSRPVVRRMRRGGGFGAARGLEITVTIEEKGFEGSGVFLLGAILDQFFAEYVSINRFTQTVLRTVERGEIKRFAPRTGERRSL